MFRRMRWFLVTAGLLALVGADQARSEPTAPKEAEEIYRLQQLLVDTLDEVERNYVKDVSRRELVEAAIRGILSELDPYSAYIGPEQMRQFHAAVESEFGGIGVQVSVDGDWLTVLSPLFETPAYRAGVLSGDRIVKIEGESTEGITIDAAVKLLKGPPGTEVSITVVHAGQAKETTLSIAREKIHVNTVLGDHRKESGHWDYMLDEEEHIGYIRITGFSRGTASELAVAMTELKRRKLAGLVLDLRFNPGGLLSSAISVSDAFVPTGRIVSTQGRSVAERVWDARKPGTHQGFPMVVLVNRYSASASEIVAACLQDHQRAVVMGERTWGKGSVQNVIELEPGDDEVRAKSVLKLTTAAYVRPSGKNIHRFPDSDKDDEWGVMPNDGYLLELTYDELSDLNEYRRDRDILKPPPASTAKPSSQGDDSPESASESEPAEGATTTRAAFVDVQLRMALDYLNSELAQVEK